VREHIESSATDDLLPQLVISSPAVRARETAEVVMPALPGVDLEFDDALYSQDAAELIHWLRIFDPEVSCLMVVGHNPTLLELCVMLAAPTDSEAIEQAGLATAGLVQLEQQGATTWGDLLPGASKLVHRFTPQKS
jgi:phosphohistidine phosphatase